VREGWRTVSFADAVEDVSGGNAKTPQSEFLPRGRFAVVDQGKELIAGFVDDEARLCHAELPVIVFGDHTRCFKYVDFPFCIGADGVKVLRPTPGIDAKYLYRYLRQLRLTEGGYDRHFKYLRRSSVLLPPVSEQHQIAEVLDQVEALRAKRRAGLAQVDQLTQAIFLDMFGDPISNPSRWPVIPCDDLCERITVGIVVRPASYYVKSGVPALRSMNVRQNEIVTNELVFFDERVNESLLSKTRIWAGDVLVVRSGQPGTAAVVPPELDGANAIDILIVTPDTTKVEPAYLCHYFNSEGGRQMVLGAKRGQVQQHLNVGSLKVAAVPSPPIRLQHEFARRVVAVDKLKGAQRASLAHLDSLFASLQHRAFRGEL